MLLRVIVGLEALRDRKDAYPYPDTLRAAWNALTYHGVSGAAMVAPLSLSGLLRRCARPLKEWFPPQAIPSHFPSSAPLLYPGPTIELSDAASELLNDAIFSGIDFDSLKLHDARFLNRFLENQKFLNLLTKLRSRQWTPALQADYIRLRRFLIEHPYTTRGAISDRFVNAASLTASEVGLLYEDCHPDSPLFQCDQCGLLKAVNHSPDRLTGDKPELCNDHARNAPHVRRIAWEGGLRRVLPSVNARITLHGIAEIRLFNRLHALQQERPKVIKAIEEWPGIDLYDLRIVFTDGVIWAVDVKEYADPNRLSPELVPLRGLAEQTRFDHGFYVIPTRRLHGYPTYLEDARQGASELPDTYKLCDEDMFVALVASYRPEKSKKA